MTHQPQRLVLASASPRRLDLLRQIGVIPDAVRPSEVDESPHPKESPRQLAVRLATEKAVGVSAQEPDAYILAADTVVALGRRVLPKVEVVEDGRACLHLLSGRAHRVLTGISVIAPGGRCAARLVESRVQFKRLSEGDVARYLAAGEGLGKAGGYAIQGRAGAFVMNLHGSYTGVVGLPLYETVSLLTGLGFRLP